MSRAVIPRPTRRPSFFSRFPFSRRKRLRLATRVALLLLSVATLPACDAREREIRSKLSDAALLLFDRGSKLSAPCWACHDFYGRQNKIGPHLSGLYGRRAGESTFGAYSEALRETGVTWDDASLDRFLANPQRFAPGTTMVSPGIGDSADRAALLFYLKEVTH